MKNPFDADDRAIAAADLVGRSGACNFEIGYLHDGVPVEEADWYAHAQYRGARIIAEHHTGPAEAAEALAVRLLTGAQCQHCKGLVALSRAGATFFPDGRFVNGKTFDEAGFTDAAAKCLWHRDGTRWVRGCEMT